MFNTHFIGFHMSFVDITNSIPALKSLTSDASGSTQVSRNLLQLANEFFSIEERNLSDWLNYVSKFSQQLAFIDQQLLTVNGSWQAAIPSIDQAKELEYMLQGKQVSDDILALAQRPDIALLLAFFQMLKASKNQFENLTSQHKQYYYRHVLGFKEIPQVADKAHLVIKLAESQPCKTLLKGSQFIGGEDADGNVLLYENIKNTVLNHSQVSKVLTLAKMPVVTSDNAEHQRLLLTQGYQLEEGLEFDSSGILTFGDANIYDDARQFYPQIGFTIASQHLYLASGVRIIELKFNFKDDGGWISSQYKLTELFEISISTVEGLVKLEHGVVESQDVKGVIVTITLDEFHPAICSFIDEEQPLLPALPHISFMLNDQSYLDTLSIAYFNSINLSVDVKGLIGVVANHDIGSLDTTKPFEPFTYAPRIASRFDFTHPELLIKNIDQAELNLDWIGRPKDIATYYSSYAEYRKLSSVDPAFWKINKTEIFHSDVLSSISDEIIFNNNEDTDFINNINVSTFSFIAEDNSLKSITNHEYGTLPLSNQQANQWPKWFSLVLTNNDFGHTDYPQVVQHFALQKTQVPQPYTPLLNKISINYKSQVKITLS